MDFDHQLKRYADLIVKKGMNVQAGQDVYIAAEPIHRDFACLIAENAYQQGARFVAIDLPDARSERLRMQYSSDENLTYVPGFIPVKYKDIVDNQSANIRILGPENPDILKDLDPAKINKARQASRKAIRYFYEEGIGKCRVHWTLAAASTPLWAKKVFPDLSPEKANAALWEDIFKICRVDTPDYMERFEANQVSIKKRSKTLNELKLAKLHFVGPGTDLHVGLSAKAIFKGGADMSPRGVLYECNMPSEEVFTTPDWRTVSGKVKVTRPVMVNGRLVRDINIGFANGEISSFSAEEGEEFFKAYINTDAGAKRLGEVALVGIDSPIFQTGRIYQEILYDENASCHIAVGSAYRFCIEGGENMTDEQAKEIGCNESNVHTDMMISSEEVDVFAVTHAGEEIQIIAKGAWCDKFRECNNPRFSITSS
ncbi:MAG: aminopeptidase [Deltaproteobacteria bacterium]|nr:aminopeptidase [Deltaproteobacteria bacterium]